jgi:acyl-CoA hydrolase
MAKKSQIGMQGVYLVAAELTSLGFIVSLTSRSAFGADLLVTDQLCRKSWSVQVKTTTVTMSVWHVGEHARKIKSPTHVYVFVKLKEKDRPEYYVVPSEFVAKKTYEFNTKNATWYSFDRSDAKPFLEGWTKVFGRCRSSV